jgi:hypothetical protein
MASMHKFLSLAVGFSGLMMTSVDGVDENWSKCATGSDTSPIYTQGNVECKTGEIMLRSEIVEVRSYLFIDFNEERHTLQRGGERHHHRQMFGIQRLIHTCRRYDQSNRIPPRLDTHTHT